MHNDECYKTIFSQYKNFFAKKEDKLMKICGWNGVTDSQWIESMQTLSLRSEGNYIIPWCSQLCCYNDTLLCFTVGGSFIYYSKPMSMVGAIFHTTGKKSNIL